MTAAALIPAIAMPWLHAGGDQYHRDVEAAKAEIVKAGAVADDLFELGDALTHRVNEPLCTEIASRLNAGQSWDQIGAELLQPLLDSIVANRALTTAIEAVGNAPEQEA